MAMQIPVLPPRYRRALRTNARPTSAMNAQRRRPRACRRSRRSRFVIKYHLKFIEISYPRTDAFSCSPKVLLSVFFGPNHDRGQFVAKVGVSDVFVQIGMKERAKIPARNQVLEAFFNRGVLRINEALVAHPYIGHGGELIAEAGGQPGNEAQ